MNSMRWARLERGEPTTFLVYGTHCNNVKNAGSVPVSVAGVQPFKLDKRDFAFLF